MQKSLRVYPDNSGVVIVDFDNVFKRDIAEYSYLDIELFLKDIVRTTTHEIENLRYIEIRLYGGWYRGDILTPRASMLQQYLSAIRIFPKIISDQVIIKGHIEIATTLIVSPNLLFENTLREKNGIARIRVKNEYMSAECSRSPNQCPVKILSKFTKDKSKVCGLNDCSVIHSEIIKGYEQKMVDTMMACDTLYIIQDENINGIFLVSNDTDIIPPLIQAKLTRQQGNVFLVHQTNYLPSQYQNILDQVQVQLIEIS